MTSGQHAITVGKPVVFVLALVPFGLLVRGLVADSLGPNPVEEVTKVTGTWALRFILLTIAMTPMRRATHWQWLIRLRRMFGLFAFFYAALHFTTYLVLDQNLDLSYLGEDIAKRPFITVGFVAFSLMIPLAATSTSGMIRRLGGRRWRRLHRLVYLVAIAAVLHYFWLVKIDVRPPLIHAALVGLLLLSRVRVRTQAPTLEA